MLLKQREKAIKHGDARATTMLLDYARDLEDEAEARAGEANRQALDEEDRALIATALQRLSGDDEAKS